MQKRGHENISESLDNGVKTRNAVVGEQLIKSLINNRHHAEKRCQ